MTDWASDGGGLDETGTDNRVSLGFERETVAVSMPSSRLSRCGKGCAKAGNSRRS